MGVAGAGLCSLAQRGTTAWIHPTHGIPGLVMTNVAIEHGHL